MTGRRQLLLVLVSLIIAGAVNAQEPDLDAIDTRLEGRGVAVRQAADRLEAEPDSDAALATWLQTLLGYQVETRDDQTALQAALARPQAELNDLGPPPAEGEPAEAPKIAEQRALLDERVARLTGLLEEANLVDASVDRLISRVRELQAARFLRGLTERGPTPFSPQVWRTAAADLRSSVGVLFADVAAQRADRPASGGTFANLALLAAALAGAIGLLAAPAWPIWHRVTARWPDAATPSAIDKSRRLAATVLSRATLVAAAGALLHVAATESGLITDAARPLAARTWLGAVVLTLIWSFARGVFAPRQPEWRIAAVDSTSARHLQALLVAIFGILVVERILAGSLARAPDGPELTLALASLATAATAVLSWRFLSPKLWGSGSSSVDGPETDAPAADAAPPSDFPAVLRALGRAATVVLLVLLALGYVRLASFSLQRIELGLLFLIVLALVRVLVRWGLTRLSPGAGASGTDPTTDDRDRARLGFFMKLTTDCVLLVLSIPALLLTVGFDWLEVERLFGLLSRDFRVGSTTVSFGSVFAGVSVFLVGIVGSRWVTGRLDRELSDHSPLDIGERGSVTTLVNLVGLVLTTLVALSIAGIGFSNLAIVAGALSVGIGFGLRNIVSNLVSGVMLLFQRPIQKGDWIVVKSGEGYVKQIGANATEVQTFDHASVIIPNTELVTSSVTNWFYRERYGQLRIVVPGSVDWNPEQVRDILLRCAEEHPSVEGSPPATVRFVKLDGETRTFELLGQVTDYNDAPAIASDLRFAIDKALRQAGIVTAS